MFFTVKEWVNKTSKTQWENVFNSWEVYLPLPTDSPSSFYMFLYQYGNCIINYEIVGLDENDGIYNSDWEELASIMQGFFYMNFYKYTTLAETEHYNYNPIENYNMIEHEDSTRTPDLTNQTTYGNSTTLTRATTDTITYNTIDLNTPNLTETITPTQEKKTETRTPTQSITTETRTPTQSITTETKTLADNTVKETTKPVVSITTTNSTTEQVSAFDSNTFVNDKKTDTTQTVIPQLGGESHNKGDTKETETTYNNTEITETDISFRSGKDKEIIQTNLTFASGKDKEIIQTDISFAAGKDKETITKTGTNQNKKTGTEATGHTGTDTEARTGTDTTRETGEETKERDLTRSGNIGVTTTQQMIEQERLVADFSVIKNFLQDLAKYICIGFKN